MSYRKDFMDAIRSGEIDLREDIKSLAGPVLMIIACIAALIIYFGVIG